MKKEMFSGLVPVWKICRTVLSLLILVGMVSCGGGKDDPNSVTLELKPELGDLGNFLTIDSKDVKISLSEFSDDDTPYVKLASTLQVIVKEDVATNYNFDMDVVILDKDLNELTDFGYYEIEDKVDYDAGDFNHYLKTGNYRAVLDKSGPKSEWEGKASAMWDIIREKGAYLILKPQYNSAKFKAYTGSDSGSSISGDETEPDEGVIESVTIASGEDWDKILDEYEKYCDKTVTLVKKAQAGDMSAMTEYASLLESAESLQKKLENAGSELSAAQSARLNKIVTKMANAMM